MLARRLGGAVAEHPHGFVSPEEKARLEAERDYFLQRVKLLDLEHRLAERRRKERA